MHQVSLVSLWSESLCFLFLNIGIPGIKLYSGYTEQPHSLLLIWTMLLHSPIVWPTQCSQHHATWLEGLGIIERTGTCEMSHLHTVKIHVHAWEEKLNFMKFFVWGENNTGQNISYHFLRESFPACLIWNSLCKIIKTGIATVNPREGLGTIL